MYSNTNSETKKVYARVCKHTYVYMHTEHLSSVEIDIDMKKHADRK